MSDLRIINGFIEINYERYAQILPGKDERTLREEIAGASELDDAREEAYNEGFEAGKDKADEMVNDFNDRIDRFLDRLLKNGDITEEQLDLICEGIPCE